MYLEKARKSISYIIKAVEESEEINLKFNERWRCVKDRWSYTQTAIHNIITSSFGCD